MKFCTYLARSGHTHCAGPVVVEMGHLVGESLDDVNLPVAVIMDDDVVRRRDGSLTHVLTHQEEVIPKGKGLFSYSAVSSPLDRSKRFIHFFCPSWQTCSLRHQLGFFGKHSVLYKWPY